jgi:uncharacterized membrane protein
MDDNNQNTVPREAEVVNTNQTNASNQPNSNSSFEFNETNIMAALSYFGPLVIVPFLTKKDDAFVKFHIKQGIVLLIPGLFIYVFGWFLYFIYPVIVLINLCLFALAVYGIVKALQHKEDKLPFIGQFADKINF